MSLKILNRFPNANARILAVRTEQETPEIEFSSDPSGDRDALWFRFVVKEMDGGEEPPHDKLRLVLRFFNTLYGCDNPIHCRPVYQPRGKGWFRAGAGAEQRHDDGRSDVSWTIPYPAPSTEIAFCYPYGNEELDTLVRKSRGNWQDETIGLSSRGRPLRRLGNDHANLPGSAPGIYIVARAHAGETPGSWVLDGLLDRLSREKKLSARVRAVPLLSCDAIDRGAFRSGDLHLDPETTWTAPSPSRERSVVMNDMKGWAQMCKPQLVLNLRSPGGTDAEGVVAVLPDPDADAEVHGEAKAWANSIANIMSPDYAATECVRVHPELHAQGTLMSFARTDLGACGLTFLVPYAQCSNTLMNQKQYRDVGRTIAKGLLDRLR